MLVCSNEYEPSHEEGWIETMNSCPLCDGKADRRWKLPHTVIWRCRRNDCGLEFASPQLEHRELASIYSALYYPSMRDNGAVSCEGTSESVLHQVLPQLEASLGPLRGLRLLDYGCGWGALSRIALALGLRPVGVEPDPVARHTSAAGVGMSVYANLEELCSQDPHAQFDLVVLWNTIEHLRKPWSELQKIRRLLHTGGRLLVCTMNTHCLRARLERGRWTIYQHPTHLYYFDRTSLERVLHSGGFLRTEEWKPKIRYPHHGPLRRYFYELFTAFGLSDGLYYLCSTGGQELVEVQLNFVRREGPRAYVNPT